jgi:hypothetical protein
MGDLVAVLIQVHVQAAAVQTLDHPHRHLLSPLLATEFFCPVPEEFSPGNLAVLVEVELCEAAADVILGHAGGRLQQRFPHLLERNVAAVVFVHLGKGRRLAAGRVGLDLTQRCVSAPPAAPSLKRLVIHVLLAARVRAAVLRVPAGDGDGAGATGELGPELARRSARRTLHALLRTSVLARAEMLGEGVGAVEVVGAGALVVTKHAFHWTSQLAPGLPAVVLGVCLHRSTGPSRQQPQD